MKPPHGRAGGKATLAKYGPEHFSLIARRNPKRFEDAKRAGAILAERIHMRKRLLRDRIMLDRLSPDRLDSAPPPDSLIPPTA